eukprot:192713-Rhodomonas_salina.5
MPLFQCRASGPRYQIKGLLHTLVLRLDLVAAYARSVPDEAYGLRHASTGHSVAGAWQYGVRYTSTGHGVAGA